MTTHTPHDEHPTALTWIGTITGLAALTFGVPALADAIVRSIP